MIFQSGAVVTIEAVNKLIRKDMMDPINGKKMTEKDIIPIQRVRIRIFKG
jgi:nitric oxide synthase-interacting protein